MQIQQIQSQTFESKQRFLNKTQRLNLQAILGRMTSESTFEAQEFHFTTKMLQSVRIGKSARLFDQRFQAKPSYNMQGQSTLEIGHSSLTFDNETGEIIKHKKPFYLSWTRLLKKADKILQLADNNFNNKKIVKKRFVSFEGLTSKGVEVIQIAMGKKKGAKK